jgi:pimeloyl-ACP methyl ester carboxylesterase
MAGRWPSPFVACTKPAVGLSVALCLLPAVAACASPSATPDLSPTPATGYVTANGVSLYYEVYGEGEPLVLIEGLGTATWLWWKQIPELSQHFRVIIYDQRGVGQSDKSDVPYSIPMLADDLAGLLDALGVDKAHILGISLGGCVAQEFALRYPERVNRLVLCSTSFGGARTIAPASDVLVALVTPVADRDDLRDRVALSVSEEFAAAHPGEIDQMVAWRLENPQPFFAYRRQMMSAVGWASEDRLQQIAAPTLILAGTADRVIPVGNAQLLADAIPGAQLQLLEGAGHLIQVEQPEAFNSAVVEFLKQSR